MIKTFRARPTLVEAARFDEDSKEELAKWTDGHLTKAFIENRSIIHLTWMNGNGMLQTAAFGDWVVRRMDGTFFILTDEQIEAGYDKVL